MSDLIEILRRCHNEKVIQRYNKSIYNLFIELRTKNYSFAKFNKPVQFYLIRSALYEIKNNNDKWPPSIDDIISKLKNNKIELAKSTLHRWIKDNFEDIEKMCNKLMDKNLFKNEF